MGRGSARLGGKMKREHITVSTLIWQRRGRLKFLGGEGVTSLKEVMLRTPYTEFGVLERLGDKKRRLVRQEAGTPESLDDESNFSTIRGGPES